ncbi:MAG TPA: DUF3825 domain-containing protein [Bryobacteraceae bacterium]|nr:DUF3825 domain-containing protein [Bryobacteraceae bacterium]
MSVVKYRSLYQNRKDQDPTEVFAHFHPVRSGLGALDFDAPFVAIAEKTLDGRDAWYFTQEKFENRYRNKPPKLRNYLNYTFSRLRDLEAADPGKFFVASADGNWCCFNTGLQDRHSSDLFAVFERYIARVKTEDAKPVSDWVYKGTATSREEAYHRHFGRVLPELATYSSDSRDFIFDTGYALDTDVFDHMFERAKERSGFGPDATDESVRNYLRGALENLIPKIKRNYKTAIPMYYIEDKRMQLLLPFMSSNGRDSACFLVDRDDANRCYHIKTILDLDKAYFAARLITRPDKEWLNP